jgi:hypothetical protein
MNSSSIIVPIAYVAWLILWCVYLRRISPMRKKSEILCASHRDERCLYAGVLGRENRKKDKNSLGIHGAICGFGSLFVGAYALYSPLCLNGIEFNSENQSFFEFSIYMPTSLCGVFLFIYIYGLLGYIEESLDRLRVEKIEFLESRNPSGQ